MTANNNGRELVLHGITNIKLEDPKNKPIWNTANTSIGLSGMTNVIKIKTSTHVYFVGEYQSGWKINRYDKNNSVKSTSGTGIKPTTVETVTQLTYS